MSREGYAVRVFFDRRLALHWLTAPAIQIQPVERYEDTQEWLLEHACQVIFAACMLLESHLRRGDSRDIAYVIQALRTLGKDIRAKATGTEQAR